jgi:hypothetical protein
VLCCGFCRGRIPRERFVDAAVLGFDDLVVLEEVGVEEGEIVDEAEV